MNSMVWLTLFSIIESTHILIITAFVYSFIPIHWNVVMPVGLEPERESFLYIIFLVVFAACLGFSSIFLRPRFESAANVRHWYYFIIVEATWVFLLLFAFFKWLTYRYPFYNVLPYENGAWTMPFFWMALGLSVLSKIFWPELRRIIDRIMGIPGKAHCWSATRLQRIAAQSAIIVGTALMIWPNVGATVALGFWLDQFNHWDNFCLSRGLLLSGMDYAGMITVLCALLLAGWTLFFVCMQVWLKSFWLAVLALLVGIKLNLFHYGMAPAWPIFPQLTILGQGISLDGLRGLDNVPMYAPLRMRQFFPFFFGYILPVLFVLSILYLIALRRIQQWVRKDILAVILAAYGLLLCLNYVCRPTMYAYGAMALPAAALLCFWLDALANRFLPLHRRRIFIAASVIALFTLITSREFVAYPRAVNVFGMNYAKEQGMYTQALNLSDDAALINAFLKPSQSAAVVGSFELALLNRAGHPAYFKHAPLMMSSSLDTRYLNGLRLTTKDALLDVINQLEQAPPKYIFLEQRFNGLPDEFYTNQSGLASLLGVIRNNYTPLKQGRHYIALQRK